MSGHLMVNFRYQEQDYVGFLRHQLGLPWRVSSFCACSVLGELLVAGQACQAFPCAPAQGLGEAFDICTYAELITMILDNQKGIKQLRRVSGSLIRHLFRLGYVQSSDDNGLGLLSNQIVL